MKKSFPWECPKCKIGLCRENGIIYSEDGKQSERQEWKCPSCHTEIARVKGELLIC